LRRTLCEQRPGQAARPGADLDGRALGERPGGTRDPPRQVEVEDEVLAEAFARADAVPRDDFAQRR
jgi:hypothetical protein